MEEGKLDGVELVKKALRGFSNLLLFAVDKLMSELVVGGGGVLTLAPMNAFYRKLVHIMAERYGLKSETHPGITIMVLPPRTYSYIKIELMRVVISWTPTARVPDELIGDLYCQLKGKRSEIDKSDRKGAYRHINKPVWETRQLRASKVECDNEADNDNAGEALTTAFNSAGAFPFELLMAIFKFLPCEDLVCVGLVCQEWSAVSMEPSLWRVLCMANLNQVGEVACGTQAVVPTEKQKNEEDQAIWERIRDQQEWREFYVAHYWEWKDATTSSSEEETKKKKKTLRWQYSLEHSHRFLGSDICRRPH